MNRYARTAIATVFSGALVLGLTACGDDDDKTSGTEPTEAASPDAPETVEVTAVDYAFEGLPEEVAAGTKLTMKNTSKTELHEMVAFRLPDSETRSVAELMQLPEDQLGGVFAGEPAFVMYAEPDGGETIPALGDGTLSEPGRYLLMCAIPVGADPAAYLAAAQTATEGPPQVAGGPPHFVQGMHAELRVK